MPMNNLSQARIEMSEAQAVSLADEIRGLQSEKIAGGKMPPMIWIEETNLGTTLAIGGKGMAWRMIAHDGEVHTMSEIIK